MYPTNQYVDPYYSYYRHHTPYSYYPSPGFEGGQHRAMDPAYRPPSYGPWPYSAGMSHPHPPEFHCCGSHSYPPGYYGFRPPFPQELPPQHLYYHGPFPLYPNEYPSYFARPHPYPVEQPPCDYNSFKSHCCGCPNHVCHGGEKSSVKIEEERVDGKPERELTGADNSSIIRHPNNQYPVIWLPPGNTEDKENGKRYELPPQFFNSWVPLGGKRAEDAKQQGQDDRKEKQFQWPMLWMPAGYDEPKQKTKELKEKDENPKITEETLPSPKIKIIPLSWFEDQMPTAKSGSRDQNDRSAVENQPVTAEHRDGMAGEGHHKTTPDVPKGVNDEKEPTRENYKTIPVLPKKETDEKKVATCRTIPVMTQKEYDEKKPVVTEQKEETKASSAEKQGQKGKGNHPGSTTAKHSKLPPVCLRLDPLPRKKSGSGSSRSPSPPTRKDVDKAKEDVKEAQNQNLEPKQSDINEKHMVASELKEKSSEKLNKGMGFSNETVLAPSANSQEEVTMGNDHQKIQASSTSTLAHKNADAETSKEGGKSTDTDSGTFRANLSEADAAARIQSAYRGYDIRRWQPLDKLRKIKGVHEQMEGVRKQLQSLEASSKKPTEKEQVAISEAIMNLLLKLDAIQGLHPSLREARKSIARELNCLQEKLDSLCKQPSNGFNTNEDERLDRTVSVSQTAGPTLRAEASDKSESKETAPVNSVELCGVIPSEVRMEVGKEEDAYPSDLESQKQSCTSTVEVPRQEEKAAEQFESQGASSTDVMCAASLPEHPHDNHKRQIKESNAESLELNEEEKRVAVTDEGQEMPLVDTMAPLHDAAGTVDSSRQENCMASTEQSFHVEQSNTGVSPTVTGDIKSTTAPEASENGLAADNDGSVVMGEVVDVVGQELKHAASPSEETPDVILESPPVSSKDEEPHKHDTTSSADLVTSNLEEHPEEAKNLNMQEQKVDSMQDSVKEPDGTSEASTHDIEPAASEEPALASLFNLMPECDSVPEQTVLKESNKAIQSGLSDKDEVPRVDQKNEGLEATGGELDVQESNHGLAEGADTRAETIPPELDSIRSSCAHEDAITGYDMPEMKVSMENKTTEQIEGEHSSCADAPKADESTEAPKEASASMMEENSVQEVDARMSETEECNWTPNDSTICAPVVTSANLETDNQKEDVSVQIESKASGEALFTSVTPDGAKDSDEKNLAEENQKLRALLQKLLASGNDQMEVITELSEKVKVLERKLARKKKPKVRVHRPARHTTAEVP